MIKHPTTLTVWGPDNKIAHCHSCYTGLRISVALGGFWNRLKVAFGCLAGIDVTYWGCNVTARFVNEEKMPDYQAKVYHLVPMPDPSHKLTEGGE